MTHAVTIDIFVASLRNVGFVNFVGLHLHFCSQSNSEEEDEEEDMELFVYCVTCGHEVRQRGAIKHMEKCFIKVFTSLLP